LKKPLREQRLFFLNSWDPNERSTQSFSENLGAESRQLNFAFPIPVRRAVIGNFLQGFDQDSPQPVAAVEIHTDEFESNLVHTSAAQQDFATDFLDPQRNLYVSF
jgi:hypothetical protein